MWRNGVAAVQVTIDANSRSARCVPQRDRTGRGHERVWILGIDTALDRMPRPRNVLLRPLERLARRDPQLRRDDIAPGVLVKEFERARPVVIDFDAGLGTPVSHSRALLCRDTWRWGFLDDFLMAPLH